MSRGPPRKVHAQRADKQVKKEYHQQPRREQHHRMGSAFSKPNSKVAQTVAFTGRPPAKSAGATASRAPSAAPPSPASQRSNAAAFQASQTGEGPKPYGYGKHSASETKTREILDDAGDPQLLQNLKNLGPVAVEQPDSPLHQRNRQQSHMLEILAARAREAEQAQGGLDDGSAAAAFASQSAAAPAPSSSRTVPDTAATATSSQPIRLSPDTIASLLDERKDCESKADLERLAVEYDVPVRLIEDLARYVNTPSVSQSLGRSERLARLQSEQDDKHDGPPLSFAVWTEPVLRDAPKQIASS
ncbi:hypothetical protein V8E36_001148 [Tilletia maclaganii]